MLKEGDSKPPEKKTPPRQTWSNAKDFIFSCAGLSIGLGNLWRFPYLCYNNGGGAFLIPYLFFVIFLGIPLLFVEISLGQLVRKGLSKTWSVIPIFRGIKYANVVIMFYCNYFYVIIMAWVLKYMISSFTNELPWATCNNEWNSDRCVASDHSRSSSSSAGNVSKLVTSSNGIAQTKLNDTKRISASEEFWNLEVLKISSGIENAGSFRNDLVLYTGLVWLLVYFSTFKGIKWSAKVVYFTATFPAVLICVVLIRGVTLEGAADGIWYYMNIDLEKLKNIEVWISAATQTVFTYSLCSGAMITLGSYNKKDHDFYKDSILIAVFNGVTSFLSGFVVFSTLGFMAKYQNTTVHEVATSGPGLVFVVYPEALTLLPFPQFWNVIFFFMLFTLGFDSEFVYQESLLAFFLDTFPKLRRFRFGREVTQAVLCTAMFLLGLIFTRQNGMYIFEIFNSSAVTGWGVFFIGGCEFVAVGWLYGADRYWKELNKMIGKCRTHPYLTFVWKFFGPGACLGISIYYITIHSPLSYGSYKYPVWAQVVAQLLSISSILCIPVYALYFVISSKINGRSLFPCVTATSTDQEYSAPQEIVLTERTAQVD